HLHVPSGTEPVRTHNPDGFRGSADVYPLRDSADTREPRKNVRVPASCLLAPASTCRSKYEPKHIDSKPSLRHLPKGGTFWSVESPVLARDSRIGSKVLRVPP